MIEDIAITKDTELTFIKNKDSSFLYNKEGTFKKTFTRGTVGTLDTNTSTIYINKGACDYFFNDKLISYTIF